jgi:hypothetical protein
MLTFAIGGKEPDSEILNCAADGFGTDATTTGFSDCITPTPSAYDNWNQGTPNPLHIVAPSSCRAGDSYGCYLGYNHSQIGLDYTGGQPRDPSQGADLVARVRQLLIPNGDVNLDGLVNVIDLGNVLSNWQHLDLPPADINQDKNVDVIDLSILLFHWTP